MKYLQKFDYIIENMSQARKVLKDNNIDMEDDKFKKIVDKTGKDGYIGFITKLVFEFGMVIDSALALYDDIKKYKVDISDPNLKKTLDDKTIPSSKKIQAVVDEMRKIKNGDDSKGFEYIFKEAGFNVYIVDEYKGIMCMGSPSWCLKTKTHWKTYTQMNKGTQFVAIDSRLVKEDGSELELKVPNTFKGGYSEPGYESTRYGITVYPNGKMDVFNDDNKQAIVKFTDDGEIETRSHLSIFIIKVLKKIRDYYIENIQAFSYKEEQSSVEPVDYGRRRNDDIPTDIYDLKEKMYSLDIDGIRTSFSYLVEYTSMDIDQIYNEFIENLCEELDVPDKENLFIYLRSINFNNHYDLFNDYSGIYDIFLNDFEVWNSQQDTINPNAPGEILPDVDVQLPLEGYENPSITRRTIPLAGFWIDEEFIDEFVIKYHYGFQHDKYGKAALIQGFGSIENFYTAIKDNLKEIFKGSSGDIELIVTGTYTNWTDISDEELFSVDDYKDGYKINFHFDKLVPEDKDEDANEEKMKIVEIANIYFKGAGIEGDDIVFYVCTEPPVSNVQESLVARFEESVKQWEESVRKRFS